LKACLFCGSDNEDPRDTCRACGHVLVPTDIPDADSFLPVIEPPDVSEIDLNCAFENGFAYPDWRGIASEVKERFSETEWFAVYHELAKRWLLELKENLGGTYRCYESAHFLLVAADGAMVAKTLLSYAQAALEAVEHLLGPLVNRQAYGKHVLLAFSEQDDYYGYISHFHVDGDHSLSGGVFLPRGYMHIALPVTVVFGSKRVLTHELVHNCIAHLPVPTWIHEGFAKKLEHLVTGQRFTLDRDLVERHYAHWNADTIQEFWSGASFYRAGDGNELSYQLAEIFTMRLSENWNDFLSFVGEADYRDGGQDAAVKVLGRDLGEVAGEFLGEGSWRPQRKAMAALRQKKASPKSSGGGFLRLEHAQQIPQ
jgi:hypothetical protein